MAAKKPTNVVQLHTNDLLRSMRGMMVNALRTFRRDQWSDPYGVSPNGKRDYNTLYGYGVHLSYDDYYAMYRRSGIAKRIVASIPHACWRDMPEIYQGETRILEKELNELKRRGLFSKLERADILNRIGKFSAMLIGIPDGLEVNQPLGRAQGTNPINQIYFQPYSEDGIEILDYVREASDPRYGLPELYQLMVIDNGDKSDTINFTPVRAHASRVVHLAENALDSDIEGNPELEAGWNYLIDLIKVTGGSGEAFFRNARQKNVLETQKDAAPLGTEEREQLGEEAEAFTNDWQEFMRLRGITHKTIQPDLASPRDSFDVIMEALSGTYGLPIRWLTGKGGGQLAGSEDRAAVNALIHDRQENYCTPALLNTLGILAEAGIIDLPDDAEVIWPVQSAMTEKEESEVNDRKAGAIEKLTRAKSSIGGDELNLTEAFEQVGFDGVKLMSGDPLDNDDEE